VRTGGSQENIVKLSDIREGKLRALSPYGPVKAGLTTLPTTQDQPLTELLSSLERKIAELNTKSCTVLDTLTTATQRIEVALHSNTQIDESGIKNC
jgi:hypothetical protein